MAHAETCPVCSGQGHVWKSLDSGDGHTSIGGGYTTVCHGCGGQGWVQVND